MRLHFKKKMKDWSPIRRKCIIMQGLGVLDLKLLVPIKVVLTCMKLFSMKRLGKKNRTFWEK